MVINVTLSQQWPIRQLLQLIENTWTAPAQKVLMWNIFPQHIGQAFERMIYSKQKLSEFLHSIDQMYWNDKSNYCFWLIYQHVLETSVQKKNNF